MPVRRYREGEFRKYAEESYITGNTKSDRRLLFWILLYLGWRRQRRLGGSDPTQSSEYELLYSLVCIVGYVVFSCGLCGTQTIASLDCRWYILWKVHNWEMHCHVARFADFLHLWDASMVGLERVEQFWIDLNKINVQHVRVAVSCWCCTWKHESSTTWSHFEPTFLGFNLIAWHSLLVPFLPPCCSQVDMWTSVVIKFTGTLCMYTLN